MFIVTFLDSSFLKIQKIFVIPLTSFSCPTGQFLQVYVGKYYSMIFYIKIILYNIILFGIDVMCL